MTNDKTWLSRCQCAEVVIEIGVTPTDSTLCHCQSCRAASGAPVLAWFTIPRAAMRMASGQLATYRSSKGVERGFCACCGTTLTYARDDLPDEIDITTCSLDQASQVAPIQHIWMADKLDWMKVNDELPRYDGWSQRHR